MVIKRSPGGQACRWRAVNFEIHLWSSGKNADCIFGDRSASSMSKWTPSWTLTPEMIPFGTKSVKLSMLIDLLTSTMSCRATQVKIASTDLWPQEMFTFSEMLALVESESSFGAYVCHRRPGGSTATGDLVTNKSLFIAWLMRSMPGPEFRIKTQWNHKEPRVLDRFQWLSPLGHPCVQSPYQQKSLIIKARSLCL